MDGRFEYLKVKKNPELKKLTGTDLVDLAQNDIDLIYF